MTGRPRPEAERIPRTSGGLQGSPLACSDELAATAQQVCGAGLDALSSFAGWLAVEGPIRGLIGPREVDRLWERHLLNCAVLSHVVPQGATVADVGSGAGLPGVVLAAIRPDLEVTLVEPMLRRVAWLDEVVEALALPNVVVNRARVESMGKRRFDVVTARAVANLGQLIEWCWPSTAKTGQLLAMKGARAAEEIEAAGPALRLRRLEATVLQVGVDLLPEPTTVVRVSRSAAD